MFTVHDTTGFFTDSTSNAGGWGGFNITGNGIQEEVSVFQYCRMQYGKKYNLSSVPTLGGLLFVNGHGSFVIAHCLVSNNMVNCDHSSIYGGPYGGAFYFTNVHYLLIDSNSFICNRTYFMGGAIYLYTGCDSVRITHNLFKRNKAIRFGMGSLSGLGSSIYSFQNSLAIPTLTPEIAYNRIFNDETVQGAINTCNNHALIHDNLICNMFGGGIEDQMPSGHSKIFNNTIANCYILDGAISLYSKAYVYNNICWGNEDYFVSENPQIIAKYTGSPDVFYNCVMAGDGGDSAVYKNPLFIEPTPGFGVRYDGALGNWALKNTSPCINRGIPDTTGWSIPEYDISGMPRFYGGRIDIGAYENQVVVGFEDMVGLASAGGAYPNPGSAYLMLRLPKSAFRVELYDAAGVLRFTSSADQETIKIPADNLRPGLYLYLVKDENSCILKRGKWIKD